jgi:hypothetical protein
MIVSNKPRDHNRCFVRHEAAGRTTVDAGHAAIAARRRLEGPHCCRDREALWGGIATLCV